MPRTSSVSKNTRWGSLTTIEKMQERGQQGFIRWLCLCDCGQLTVVESGYLANGNTKSCGCAVGYGNQRLTLQQVDEICSSDKSNKDLASEFGVTRQHIGRLRRKHT